MKKMLSLAAMLAVIGYAAPASAELKLSGDASFRTRAEFKDGSTNATDYTAGSSTTAGGSASDNEDDVVHAYRYRIRAAADLGSGYYFKAMVTNDNAAGGWTNVDSTSDAEIDMSNIYLGRTMESSSYAIGRMPLNSVNNPIYDLTLYPRNPTEIPVATYLMDRTYGFNYTHKVGAGEAKATLIVFDNQGGDSDNYAKTTTVTTAGSLVDENDGTSGNGLFNDGYALNLAYKVNVGNVTVEPQAIISLQDVDGPSYKNVSANTFGANVTIPVEKAKIGLSGFYTVCDDKNGQTASTQYNASSGVTSTLYSDADINYHGYLLRVKGEVGNFSAWVDYNRTDDNSTGSSAVRNGEYENLFVWAQYNFRVHESAAGKVDVTPIVRYWTGTSNYGGDEIDANRLRLELVSSVTF